MRSSYIGILMVFLVAIAYGPAYGYSTYEEERTRVMDEVIERLMSMRVQGKRGTRAPKGMRTASVDERLMAMEGTLEELEEELAEVKQELDASKPGSRPFLLTGNAKANYTDPEGNSSSYSTVFSPHFLWKLGERGFFESHVDLELTDGNTDVDLEFADISFVLHDALVLKAGKFLSPFGAFQEGIHAAWVNKLPDEPLPVADDGLAPTNDIGVQIRGVVPAWGKKFLYAAYVSNGPRLDTGTGDPREAGKLKFDNTNDNNNKAVGGRVAILPIPELELGYSFLIARVGADGSAFRDVDAFLQGVDFSFFKIVHALRGAVDVRAEWIRSEVDRIDYGAGAFDNTRTGSYVQLAYRPSLIHSKFFRRFETVLRYDELNTEEGAPTFDKQRWTLGLNYWLKPTLALKAACRLSNEDRSGETEDRRIDALFQAAVGF